MFQSIKRTAQTKPILNKIGHHRMMRPDIKVIYVTENGFRALVMALPENLRKNIINEIDCDDFVIKIYRERL